jgi:predicted nucleic acid-binding protein
MVLIDSSVLVLILRDATGTNADRLFSAIGDEDLAMTRFVEMEVLAGARDEREWDAIQAYLDHWKMIELKPDTGINSARIFFDLRRNGKTVRKLFDCCIAQVAIENNLTLVHNDRDFDAIAEGRPLKHLRVDLNRA